MPVELANAVLIRIANGIEDRLAGDHHYFDSASWIEQSNAQIEQWMPGFAATAACLGMSDTTAMLQETVRRTQPDRQANGLKPSRPLNYRIPAEGGAMQPLVGRQLATAGPREVPEKSASASKASTAQRLRGLLATAVRRVAKVDVNGLVALNGGTVSKLSGGVRIVCDPQPWAYSGYLRLDGLPDANGAAEIQVRIHAERGTLGMMLLERGSSVHQIAPEQSVAPSGDAVVVRFEVAALKEAGDLVFRGWPSADGRPQAVVHEIHLLRK
jgi:hypothetical protein